ncbi:hypothetical protein ACGF7W_34395 [Streptomyces sp. NPDC048219]|uniref:hypothetical protein n=1 Tax=Streptomyces sp. NPDC048219 TaxID=3365517 RepID=UPI00370FA0B7
MTANTTADAPQTGAEWMAAEREEDAIRYAVEQLNAGKFLVLTNDSEGRRIGNAGLDPRQGREWLTRHCESGVRKWD